MAVNIGKIFLRKNEKKTTPKHPDYKGSGKVNDKDVWISGWINKSEEGETYLSCTIDLKEAPKQSSTTSDDLSF